MSVQLHLPDLPEVPVTIGAERGAPCAPRLIWQARLRGLLGSALPVALMALLAVGSWWLVKNSPQPPAERVEGPVRHLPDYQVERFTLQRFNPQGGLSIQIEGSHMRHYPDSDQFEIDTVHLHAIGIDGRDTEATAREAIAAGDGSWVRLVGGAHVISRGAQGEEIEIEGERLLALVKERRLIAEQPVRVRQGRNEYSASGLVFDEATRQLTLNGPARAMLYPKGARP